MNEWKKGSFTVESAFLITMAVMLTALLIVFTFYAHNKVWYTAAAYEAALAGNGRREGNEWDASASAKEKAEERSVQQVMPGSKPDIYAGSSPWGTEVRYSGQRFPMFSEHLFTYTAEAKVEKVRPVKYLRALWLMKELEGSISSENPE